MRAVGSPEINPSHRHPHRPANRQGDQQGGNEGAHNHPQCDWRADLEDRPQIQPDEYPYDNRTAEIEELAEKLEQIEMPEVVRAKAKKELGRLRSMPPGSPETAVVRTYLDWLLDLPWGRSSEEQTDIGMARRVLDKDHYGLRDVKDRIVEYLAVRNLLAIRDANEKTDSQSKVSAATGVILCFAGPPGVGKTSLGQSIARAMGREFTRMSLGGVRDEAEIRGHRRTYIGAMPGRIIQAIKRAGTRNPVFMLDEVDKIGKDWRGDPSSALLEVLDPAQNSAFRDHYLDVDFDLSDVVFIATANQLETIPAPLRDRMEIIQLDGYTELEKLQIAKRHLIPRQLSAHGLSDSDVTFMDEAVRKTIGDYTREAGVRQLERLIGAICRKAIVKLTTKTWEHVMITPEVVSDYLKKEKFENEVCETIDVPGMRNEACAQIVRDRVSKIIGVQRENGGSIFVDLSAPGYVQIGEPHVFHRSRGSTDIARVRCIYQYDTDIIEKR